MWILISVNSQLLLDMRKIPRFTRWSKLEHEIWISYRPTLPFILAVAIATKSH